MNKAKKRFARRAQRVRGQIRRAHASKPRLSVFCSNKNIYAQIIDDSRGVTLAAASSLSKELSEALAKKSGSNIEAARQIGQLIATKGLEAQVVQVVFDRGGKKFHGCLAALAAAAREGGLVF